MNIVILGSGNLATHLALALQGAGHCLQQVCSPTEEHARELALRLGCGYATSPQAVSTTADAYVIAVKDDAVGHVAAAVAPRCPGAVLIHTAGSIDIGVLQPHAARCGVLYPMQTFSKGRQVDFRPIPCFIEASDAATLATVRQLAASIADRVVEADSHRRKRLHLAAVLACNLANHCYRLAERVLEPEGISLSLYQPLIEETAHKVATLSPRQAQTGPMVRYDRGVMDMQVALLPDERTRQIYRLMADSIHDDYADNSQAKGTLK